MTPACAVIDIPLYGDRESRNCTSKQSSRAGGRVPTQGKPFLTCPKDHRGRHKQVQTACKHFHSSFPMTCTPRPRSLRWLPVCTHCFHVCTSVPLCDPPKVQGSMGGAGTEKCTNRSHTSFQMGFTEPRPSRYVKGENGVNTLWEQPPPHPVAEESGCFRATERQVCL